MAPYDITHSPPCHCPAEMTVSCVSPSRSLETRPPPTVQTTEAHGSGRPGEGDGREVLGEGLGTRGRNKACGCDSGRGLWGRRASNPRQGNLGLGI